ncbi:hypothetical protein GCM10009639_33980 [Kitasatospora putterlickiae]|uniref:Uncharacterized protein n=1 Tax=Kitasatospora putterlickiae TaxID=221725 RepID=A0ABN1Y5R6_9ACTN
MFSRAPKPPQSRQQRRAKAVREADRAGKRQIDSHRTSRSTTAWHRAESPRAWWRPS